MRPALLPAAAFLAIAVAAPGGAEAAGSLAAACQMDVQLFCPALDPESPRAAVEACLEGHRDVLTESCRAVVDPGSLPPPAADPLAPLARACRRDFARHCGQEATRMGYARCVQRSRPHFSSECRAALDDVDGANRIVP